MRRQHVVIGGDNADVRYPPGAAGKYLILVGARGGGGMCHIGTADLAPVAVGRGFHCRYIVEIGLSLIVAATADPFGYTGNAVDWFGHGAGSQLVGRVMPDSLIAWLRPAIIGR